MINKGTRFASAATLASAITVALGAADALGDNIATSTADPAVTIIANAAFGVYGTANNDGNTTATSMYLPNIAQFQQPGFGYDFGGYTSINSITVNYDGAGNRPTLETVNVFTSAGEQTITNLTDVYSPYTDGPQTITLSSAVNTTYVYVQPTAYYTHGDPNIGISEVGVNSTTNLVIPRPNLALNAAVSASASWTTTANGANPAGVVTSGNLMQHSDTADSTAYTLQMAGIQAGNYIQLNLGVPTLTGTIGVDQGTEYDSDGDPRREMLAGFTLQFSNDPNFGTLVSSQDLSVADNLAYEQLDYSPVLAQYVRLIADSQDAEAPTTGNYASDPTNVIAIQQIQLFAPTPEPASIALLAFGGIGLLARRRPVRLPQSLRQIVH